MVEGSGLENRQGRKPFVGSNPTLSANILSHGGTIETVIVFLREQSFRRSAEVQTWLTSPATKFLNTAVVWAI